ncbi:hypothetical protein VM1G_03737 [Cytospora mali]|uniref:EthD domain-containing protein n=1 Tax=Cytospora mali TaxID=578113 RepID=A0A194VW03_CYTMA|nr:hypothetical protein VM1G_03737 [Valsa mali]
MSGALVTVLYPSALNAKFDLEYYKTKHMPLVVSKWGKYGLKKYYVADLRGAPGPYIIQCTMVFDSGIESFQAAAKEEGEEVMGDLVNFSSEQPIILSGGVVHALN